MQRGDRLESKAGAAPARPGRLVALAPFLSHVRAVRTLGIRPRMADYTREERRALLGADRVLYPTPRFATVLEAAGCRCFPSAFTYSLWKDRTLQWRTAAYAQVPLPWHRICHGDRAKQDVLARWGLPLRAAGPRCPRDPVLTVDRLEQWEQACRTHNPLMVWRPVQAKAALEVFCVQDVAVAWRLLDPEGHLAGERTVSVRQAVQATQRWFHEVRVSEALVRWVWTGDQWLFDALKRPPSRWRHGQGVCRRFQIIADLVERGLV
ncbi:hypothetical protein SAMN02746041_03019 [Desulfacinum hydrothermale DSM 13146]|uniref:Uncharacterized protein n=1 Tax=Desulfacinum hydrothermale DSM 13146 TaxID=1121390 RepID=A0A1W1XUI5_9BACT|nr:hypothetical protein [Desulfacinum hydrothermale]SMC27623.1 hypothetical protein SAMN02746041_03019 [Desulfacinum hydrothermale DSM 13146]